MPGPTRITGPLLDVVEVLLRALDDNAEPHGWAIIKATRRSGPTVYGVLDRLEDGGWITGRWEERDGSPGRPRRRFYRLTPTGVAAARDLLAARRPEPLRRLPPRPARGVPFLARPRVRPLGGLR